MGISGYGDHGQPLFTTGPRTRADFQENADYARKVGNRIAGTSSERVTAGTNGQVWNGLEWYETDTHITYLRLAGAWRAWDCGWRTFPPFFSNIGFSAGNWLWRYAAGEVLVRGDGTVSGAPAGRISMSLSVEQNAAHVTDYQDRVDFTRQGDNRFRGAVSFKDTAAVYLDAAVTVTRNGNQVTTADAVTASKPFSWANGDGISFRFGYTPA